MPDHNERVAEMLRRATQPLRIPRPEPIATLNEVLTENLELVGHTITLRPNPELIIERTAINNRERDLGLQGLEKSGRGQALSAEEATIAEAIVLPQFRPCVDIVNDTFGDLPDPWGPLAGFRSVINRAIRGAGRIDLPNFPNIPYGGTGFVVGENLLLTNRHVAELFTSGLGRHLTFRTDLGTAIDFKQEVAFSEPQLLKVRKTMLIHPHWDAALLVVDGLDTSRVLTLAANQPANLDGRTVVVIGYPMLDHRNDLQLQQSIFRGVYGKKRLLPGTLMSVQTVTSFGKKVEAITHDSSTLGGNSGSLVLDVETGLVVGLHFAGKYMEANYAVPSWELACDDRLKGITFDTPNRPADFIPPSWLSVWNGLGETLAAEPASTPTEASQLPAVADWFERTSTDELAQALQRDPTGTRALLHRTLLPNEADALIADLTISQRTVETFPPIEEGLFSPRVDPNLPEIIFLHGISGSHLTGGNGLISRLWLNPLAFVAGDMAEKLMLADDGLTDAQPGSRIVSDGHIRYIYERAARTWRQQGFVVHPFAFDWRKGVAQAADRLHLFVENLRLDQPNGKPFVIVAHSMGGLVASLYAQRHPEWEERIDQAIFLGSPVRGSFAPVEAVLGSYPFLVKLARLCRNDDVTDLRRMACSMPGMLDMLPDPAVFIDAPAVYKQRFWPDHIVPQKKFLDQSLLLKESLSSSPLLKFTTGIVSLIHGTVGSLGIADGRSAVGPATAVGDGTVPGRSCVIPARPNFKALSEHAQLPRDPAVIQAVSDLIRTGKCALQPVTAADDLNATLPATETLDPIPLEAAVASMPLRINEGNFTQADYDWLVSR